MENTEKSVMIKIFLETILSDAEQMAKRIVRDDRRTTISDEEKFREIKELKEIKKIVLALKKEFGFITKEEQQKLLEEIDTK